VLTQNEKAIAQKEYNKELEQINWKNIEKNLKAQYEKVDWNQLNAKLVQAENIITIDSLHQVYSTTLSVLNKAEKELLESKSSCSPIPDVSVCELQKAKAELKTHVEVLKALRNNKKVIRL
ncbi:MAG TPA: hypothetical protein VEX63_13135, partial [Flavisolibacter sp.]|nr:hypothetical protein [Flavisolibacter sp.]